MGLQLAVVNQMRFKRHKGDGVKGQIIYLIKVVLKSNNCHIDVE